MPKKTDQRTKPRLRYVRSVHLERDFEDIAALRDYVVTDATSEALERMLESLRPESRQRAWRLTGTYGSGKSSLALALAQILWADGADLPVALRSLCKLRKKSLRAEKGMMPILLTASRAPMARTLLERMVEAHAQLGQRGRAPAFIGRARAALEKNHDKLDDEVMACAEAMMAHLHDAGQVSGICLVVDELGKFLEYAMLHPERQDVYLLQRLAELASRSGEFPLLLLGILHQGFSTYAERASIGQQKEWEKIAGRYEEIVFQPSLEQSLVLAGSALRSPESLSQKLRKQITVDLEKVIQLGWFGAETHGITPERALAIHPIHPSAFPVLVRLFQRFGQNERSLFGFLLLTEPHGLQSFVAEAREEASYYCIHHIYDYIKANLGYRLKYEPGSRWSLLEAMIDAYTPRHGDEELLVLKTVAVLNLLDSQGLLATDEALELALPGQRSRMERALSVLTNELRVLYARGRAGGYCLWPHTSVDVRECYSRAARELGSIQDIAPYAKRILETRPIVARRHYIRTGNLRYFRVHHAAVGELESAIAQLDEQSDGHILILLCETEAQRNSATKLAKRQKPEALGGRVLIAVSPPLQVYASLFQDERCWAWVWANVPELAQDEYASKEVSRLLAESRVKIQEALGECLGLRQGGENMGIEWYIDGQRKKFRGGSEFLHLLSDLCDDAYAEGPKIHNELVNRAELSSAAAAARMRLIERIFEHPNEEMLGLDPSRKPPEMSMYLSVLEHTRLHRKDGNGDWVFAVPSPKADSGHLRPALSAVTEHLRSANEKRVSLPTIIQTLRRPPYGVRDGLILLLLAVVCAIEEHQIALYEQGSFVRKIVGEHFARMMKWPEQYELQYFSISGVRSLLFQQLLRMLDAEPTEESSHILDVVRPLLEFAGQLPPYTLRTKRLAATTVAVRHALINAREPATLVFDELPRACGLPSFPAQGRHDKAKVEQFLGVLRGALDELRAAYAELLARLRASIASAFALPENLTASREALARRAEQAMLAVREPRLKGFCLRLADRALTETAWLESVSSFICAKPPKTWLDSDADQFEDELQALVSRFLRAESLSFSTEGDTAHAVRVMLTRPDGTEVDRVVHFAGGDEGKLVELETRLAGLLTQQDRELGLAAMSRVMWRAMQLTEKPAVSDTSSGERE